MRDRKGDGEKNKRVMQKKKKNMHEGVHGQRQTI